MYLRHGDDDDVLAWYRSSSQGQMWKMGSVTVPAGELHVVFEATRGLTYKSDIAIDDITDELGTCDPDGKYTCIVTEYTTVSDLHKNNNGRRPIT